jgi:transposase
MLEKLDPSYTTVENWVARFNRVTFSTCVATCPGRPKTMTTTKNIDKIHELILEDPKAEFRLNQ